METLIMEDADEVLRARRNRASCRNRTAWLLLLASLAGNVGQTIYFEGFHTQTQTENAVWNQSSKLLQRSCNVIAQQEELLQDAYRNLTWDYHGLKERYKSLAAERDSLQLSHHNLTEERDQIQAQYGNLTEESDSLQGQFSTLTEERDQIQGQLSTLTKEKGQVQSQLRTITKKRDLLQSRFSTLSKERDQLQSQFSTLTKEKDQLQSQFSTLTKERDQLQSQFSTLTKERDQIKGQFSTLTKERDQLQSQFSTLTKERDQMEANFHQLFVENDRILDQLANRPCPPGWTKFQRTCYFVSGSEKKNWEESRQDCRSKGAQLVIINSQEEQKFVNTLLPLKTNAWMGFSDTETEGLWIWVDGTTPNTTYWESDQPNSYGGNQDCGEFIHKSSSELGEWNDESCDSENPWICEELYAID